MKFRTVHMIDKLIEIPLVDYHQLFEMDQNRNFELFGSGSKSKLRIVGKWTKIELSHMIIDFGEIFG